ncbi:alpha-tubulin N-acetyltransferase 1 [Pristis pectinata]|uniref:alpha-tubulin N-acetyltransferase 1 n=1 Tax=Pristis pectinata TaxID=685728 RepID=UPI00223CCD30|nr:alpha-tubulin N-acetyltransferase 1 [Pristis pectinata]
MEFPFDINPLFPERITVLDHHLQPGRRSSSSKATLENQLAVVLDKMGEASAKAQQLSAPITSASRMQVNRHRLYVLKDGLANHGKGAAIGFLKVGNKKLFVLDGQGAHNEMEPLCVLDFYVHVSLQRHGYGKELFDYMIQYEGIKPYHLAIDRPSSKFLSFLRKHYGLAATIPQVNNFVVFDSFFRDRQMRGTRLIHRSVPKKVEQDIKPYSITVREGLPEDKELPWPFNQTPSLTRSNSLGCSPRRQAGPPHLVQQEGLRRVRGGHPHVLNGTREADDASAHRRRTSDAPEEEAALAMGNVCTVYKTCSQSPEHGPRKSTEPCSDQNPSGWGQHSGLGGTTSRTHPVPPLDLKDLSQDSDPPAEQVPPSARLPEPPAAPRGERCPGLDGRGTGRSRDQSPEPGQPGGCGPRNGHQEGLHQPLQPEQRRPPSPRRVGGKGRGDPNPCLETALPSHAQWIRHKNKFRNTRPW